jgi:hypothetical protein
MGEILRRTPFEEDWASADRLPPVRRFSRAGQGRLDANRAARNSQLHGSVAGRHGSIAFAWDLMKIIIAHAQVRYSDRLDRFEPDFRIVD